LQFMLLIERFFLWIPWFILVAIVGVVGWRLMKHW